jgi:hypothetical protein
MMDEGHAVSFKVLQRGTPVQSSDGVKLGTVRRVQEAKRENIFDGIVIETGDGRRFVDAPEVARIAERMVTLTFSAEEADEHLLPAPSRMADRFRMAKTVRRTKRLGRRARDSWNQR